MLDNGLSFVGISFNAGERVARVVIESGNAALSATNNDGVDGVDVVAMDDFIYGEPRATTHHRGDFDGDGTTDLTVFRPSLGSWFTLNSGSNTFTAMNFGTNGDIPVDGDFDGDSRTDFTVFRPGTGTWFRLDSADMDFSAVPWGLTVISPWQQTMTRMVRPTSRVWRPSAGGLRTFSGARTANSRQRTGARTGISRSRRRANKR